MGAVEPRRLTSADAPGSSRWISDTPRDARRHLRRRGGRPGVRSRGHRRSRCTGELGARRVGAPALRPVDGCMGRDGARWGGRRGNVHLGPGTPHALRLCGLGPSSASRARHRHRPRPRRGGPRGARSRGGARRLGTAGASVLRRRRVRRPRPRCVRRPGPVGGARLLTREGIPPHGDRRARRVRRWRRTRRDRGPTEDEGGRPGHRRGHGGCVRRSLGLRGSSEGIRRLDDLRSVSLD